MKKNREKMCDLKTTIHKTAVCTPVFVNITRLPDSVLSKINVKEENRIDEKRARWKQGLGRLHNDVSHKSESNARIAITRAQIRNANSSKINFASDILNENKCDTRDNASLLNKSSFSLPQSESFGCSRFIPIQMSETSSYNLNTMKHGESNSMEINLPTNNMETTLNNEYHNDSMEVEKCSRTIPFRGKNKYGEYNLNEFEDVNAGGDKKEENDSIESLTEVQEISLHKNSEETIVYQKAKVCERSLNDELSSDTTDGNKQIINCEDTINSSTSDSFLKCGIKRKVSDSNLVEVVKKSKTQPVDISLHMNQPIDAQTVNNIVQHQYLNKELYILITKLEHSDDPIVVEWRLKKIFENAKTNNNGSTTNLINADAKKINVKHEVSSPEVSVPLESPEYDEFDDDNNLSPRLIINEDHTMSYHDEGPIENIDLIFNSDPYEVDETTQNNDSVVIVSNIVTDTVANSIESIDSNQVNTSIENTDLSYPIILQDNNNIRAIELNTVADAKEISACDKKDTTIDNSESCHLIPTQLLSQTFEDIDSPKVTLIRLESITNKYINLPANEMEDLTEEYVKTHMSNNFSYLSSLWNSRTLSDPIEKENKLNDEEVNIEDQIPAVQEVDNNKITLEQNFSSDHEYLETIPNTMKQVESTTDFEIITVNNSNKIVAPEKVYQNAELIDLCDDSSSSCSPLPPINVNHKTDNFKTSETITTANSTSKSVKYKKKENSEIGSRKDMYKCLLCKVDCKALSKLKLHLERKHPKFYADRELMKKHGYEFDVSMECNVCKMKFDTKENLFDHIIKHTESELQEAYKMNAEAQKLKKEQQSKIKKVQKEIEILEKKEDKELNEIKVLEMTNQVKNIENLQPEINEHQTIIAKKKKVTYDKSINFKKKIIRQAEKINAEFVTKPMDKSSGSGILSHNNAMKTNNNISSNGKPDLIDISVSSTIICPCHAQETIAIDGKELQMEIVFACTVCKIHFRRPDCIELHYRSNLKCSVHRMTGRIPKIICSECKFSIDSLPYMRKHVDEHMQKQPDHKVTYVCNICRIIFYGSGTLFYNHWYNHNKDSGFVGSRYSFPKWSIISMDQSNLSMESKTLRKDYLCIAEHSCKKCSTPFSSATELDNHYSSANDCKDDSTGEKTVSLPNIYCNECKETFHSKQHFDQHVVQKSHILIKAPNYLCVSITAAQRVFICNICSCVSQNEIQLKNHWEKHNPLVAAYSCTICKFNSITNLTYNELDEHFKKTHRNSNIWCTVSFVKSKHLCKLCNVGFDDSESLYKHNSIHKIVTNHNVPNSTITSTNSITNTNTKMNNSSIQEISNIPSISKNTSNKIMIRMLSTKNNTNVILPNESIVPTTSTTESSNFSESTDIASTIRPTVIKVHTNRITNKIFHNMKCQSEGNNETIKPIIENKYKERPVKITEKIVTGHLIKNIINEPRKKMLDEGLVKNLVNTKIEDGKIKIVEELLQILHNKQSDPVTTHEDLKKLLMKEIEQRIICLKKDVLKEVNEEFIDADKQILETIIVSIIKGIEEKLLEKIENDIIKLRLKNTDASDENISIIDSISTEKSTIQVSVSPTKRKRGRPKGSFKKKIVLAENIEDQIRPRRSLNHYIRNYNEIDDLASILSDSSNGFITNSDTDNSNIQNKENNSEFLPCKLKSEAKCEYEQNLNDEEVSVTSSDVTNLLQPTEVVLIQEHHCENIETEKSIIKAKDIKIEIESDDIISNSLSKIGTSDFLTRNEITNSVPTTETAISLKTTIATPITVTTIAETPICLTTKETTNPVITQDSTASSKTKEMVEGKNKSSNNTKENRPSYIRVKNLSELQARVEEVDKLWDSRYAERIGDYYTIQPKSNSVITQNVGRITEPYVPINVNQFATNENHSQSTNMHTISNNIPSLSQLYNSTQPPPLLTPCYPMLINPSHLTRPESNLSNLPSTSKINPIVKVPTRNMNVHVPPFRQVVPNVNISGCSNLNTPKLYTLVNSTQHVNSVDNSSAYSCSYCQNFSSQSLNEIHTHMLTQCSFNQVARIQTDLRSTQLFECLYCKHFKTNDLNLMRLHRDECNLKKQMPHKPSFVHSVRPESTVPNSVTLPSTKQKIVFICPFCPMPLVFEFQENLNSHIRQCHNAN